MTAIDEYNANKSEFHIRTYGGVGELCYQKIILALLTVALRLVVTLQLRSEGMTMLRNGKDSTAAEVESKTGCS